MGVRVKLKIKSITKICVARFPVELGGDGLFYRAEILTVASGMVVVRYLDYGNQEFINAKEHVLSFPNELNLTPAQAIKESWFLFPY